MSDFDFDLFVIGAGSGGVRAARLASGHGNKVAVAEEFRVGGTCVIRGCVPKKLMVYASRFSHEIKEAAGFGWTIEKSSFSWEKFIANKDREIDRLNGLYVANLTRAGVEIINSRAEIAGNNRIYLRTQDRYVTAKRILVATGGLPRKTEGLAGAEYMITSNEVFHLDNKPEGVVVVGGGYIAVEFASIFAGMNVETTLLYRGEEILRGFDGDVRAMLHQEMEKKGVRIICEDTISNISKVGDILEVETTQGQNIKVEQVLSAIGRVPYTEGLGLETVNVDCQKNGAIIVNEWSMTSVQDIYAVGDVTDRANLTPVAIREGAAFVETVYNNNPTSVSYEHIPTAVFSQPEIGTVGLGEEDAVAKFDNVDVYRVEFRPMKHTLSGSNERMLMKMIVNADSDLILGIHILGADAGELIQALGITLIMGATKAHYDATMAVHPTAAEELVTLKQPSWIYRNGVKQTNA